MLHTLSSSDSGYLHVQHEHSKITQFPRRRRKKLISQKNVGTHCLLMRVSALAQSALVAATLALLHWPTALASQDMTKQSQARLMLENNFLGTWEINWKRPRYVGFQWGGWVDIGQVSPQHCTRAKPWNRQICFKGYFSRPEPRKLVQGLVLAWACLGSWAPECFLVLHVHPRAYPSPLAPHPSTPLFHTRICQFMQRLMKRSIILLYVPRSPCLFINDQKLRSNFKKANVQNWTFPFFCGRK